MTIQHVNPMDFAKEYKKMLCSIMLCPEEIRVILPPLRQNEALAYVTVK